jgi:hypothetical protein
MNDKIAIFLCTWTWQKLPLDEEISSVLHLGRLVHILRTIKKKKFVTFSSLAELLDQDVHLTLVNQESSWTNQAKEIACR